MPFVTGSDVQALKDRLAPSFVSTGAAVHACAAAPPGSVAAWDAFHHAFVSFLQEDETTIAHEFGAGGRADLAEQYGKDLRDWQTQVTSWKCALYSPPVTPQTWQPPPLAHTAAELAAPATTLVQSLAVLAGIVLVGYVAVAYGPQIVAAASRKGAPA
jgi:hypothetical protein